MQLRVRPVRSVRRSAVALTVAAVVLTGAALTTTAADAAATDTTAPTLVSYRVLPTTVDDTKADARAIVVVRIDDTAPAGVTPTGFAQGTLTLTSGNQAIGPIGFDDTQRTSGTPTDGTYDIPVTIPQGTPAGAYSGSVYLQDVARNNATTPGATALTVTQTPDTTAPTLASLTATPATIDITRAGGTVHFAAHITDQQSGTTSAQLTLTGPQQVTDYVDLGRDTNTNTDDVWTGDYTVQNWTLPGTWTVTAATLTDKAGNTAAVTPPSTTFTVTQTADTTKPTFAGITLDRTSVDTSDGDRTVQARITAADADSGVASGYVAFVDPTTSQQVDGVFTVDPTATPDPTGTYTADITVPAFTTSGTYALADLQIVDNQGNTLELCTPPSTDGYDTYGTCDGTPPTSTITVTSSDDTTPPTLAHFTLGPATVTTAYQGTARVDGSFDVADAVSGFADAEVTLTNGTSTRTIDLTPDDLAAGTTHSGTVVFSTYLNATDAGTWTATDVTLTDLAGNTADISQASLGTSRTTTVGTAATDTAAPTLTNLTVSPNAVNTTAGAQDVTVTAGISDAQAGAVASGLATAQVTLEAPNGTDVTATLTDLVAGNSVTGTFAGPLTVARYAPAGTWKAVAVSLVDVAGNERDYGRGDPALSSATLAVTPATDTQAPTLNGVTVPATVDASSAGRDGTTVPVHVVATDSGSGIDDVSVTVTAPDGTPHTVTTPVDTTAHVVTDLDVQVPGYGSAGRWTVTGVELDSDNGPDAVLGTAALTAAGISASFVVTAPTDTTAPAVAGVAVTPSPISTAAASVDADLLVRLTDAGSGVATAWATLTSPHGYQSLSAALNLVAGDAGDGWWQGAVTLPRFVDPGTWTIEISAVDVSGNGSDTSSTALAAKGLTGSVPVTGQADTTAPTLDSLTLSRATVDLTSLSAPTSLGVDLTAHDTGSGIAAVDVGVTAPDGTTRTVSGTPTSTSTPATASYAAAIPLPLNAPGGVWSIGPVVVHDLAGNVTTLTHAQLVAAHLTANFTVVGAVTIVTPPPPPQRHGPRRADRPHRHAVRPDLGHGHLDRPGHRRLRDHRLPADALPQRRRRRRPRDRRHLGDGDEPRQGRRVHLHRAGGERRRHRPGVAERRADRADHRPRATGRGFGERRRDDGHAGVLAAVGHRRHADHRLHRDAVGRGERRARRAGGQQCLDGDGARPDARHHLPLHRRGRQREGHLAGVGRVRSGHGGGDGAGRADRRHRGAAARRDRAGRELDAAGQHRWRARHRLRADAVPRRRGRSRRSRSATSCRRRSHPSRAARRTRSASRP